MTHTQKILHSLLLEATRWSGIVGIVYLVEPEVINKCLDIAIQAPTGSNTQNWHFVVVTDPQQCLAMAELYRKGFQTYRDKLLAGTITLSHNDITPDRETMRKARESSQHLLDHLHEVPVLLIPCISDRVDYASVVEQAGTWGSIIPATWNFMLAARAHGLGTCWTTWHLYHERKANMSTLSLA
jgi:nitroreductase